MAPPKTITASLGTGSHHPLCGARDAEENEHVPMGILFFPTHTVSVVSVLVGRKPCLDLADQSVHRGN